MDNNSLKLQSNKELRFVTSAEQMLPFLNRIRDMNQTNENGDDDQSDVINEIIEPMSNDIISITNNQLTNNILAPPTITTVRATSATNLTLPNIYEEYVNFIDLSVLNPIMDAVNCQRDTLVESEISEPCFFNIYFHASVYV